MENNLNDLLDLVLDDLKELPEFKNFRPGAHMVHISIGVKEIAEKPAYEVTFKLASTVELANPEDTIDVPGTECSMAFFVDNEYGQGAFRKLLSPLAEHYGVRGIREIADAVKGVELLAITGIRKVKDKKSDEVKEYMDVKSLTVPA